MEIELDGINQAPGTMKYANLQRPGVQPEQTGKYNENQTK